MAKIGIVGIGDISGTYLTNIRNTFKELEIVAVCDLIKERAVGVLDYYRIPKVYDTMEELFADEEISIVLNLTRPYQHYGVSKAALLAGKHVYSEKPLGASLEEGRELVKIAEEKGLMLGGAPDTFLGAGIQTCRRLIDDGVIGDIVGANAALMCHGPESWHHDPEFFYKYGGGPMMDMGPYYITALINLIGGVKKVSGVTNISFKQRPITSELHYGEIIDVEVPTFTTGILHFENGTVGNITTTFDVFTSNSRNIEIYGSKGTLFVPDPNFFGGEVYFYDGEKGEMKEIPLEFDHGDIGRGLGLTEFADSIENHRLPRTSYRQTLHVLEVMEAFRKSSDAGCAVEIESKFERLAPMPKKSPYGVHE